MPSRSAIEAGAAFLRFYVDDKSVKPSLDEISKTAKARMEAVSATGHSVATAAASSAAVVASKVPSAVSAATKPIPSMLTTAGDSAVKFGSKLGRIAMAGRIVGWSGAAGFGLLARSGRAAAGTLAAPFAFIEGLGPKMLGSFASWSTGLGKRFGFVTGFLGTGLAKATSAGLVGVGNVIGGASGWISGRFSALAKLSGKAYWDSWRIWFLGKVAQRAGAGMAAPAAGAVPGVPAASSVAPGEVQTAGAATPAAQQAVTAGKASAGAASIAAATIPVRGAHAALTLIPRAADAASAALKGLGLTMLKAGAGAAIMVAPFAALTARFAGMGAGLRRASRDTGASVESLSVMRYVGQQTGVTFDAMAAAAGKAKTPEALAEIADKLAAVADPQQRARLGAKLLGDAYAGVAPALAMGGGAIRQMARDARETGSVVDEKTAKLGESVAGSAKRISGEAKSAFDVLSVSIGSLLVGDLETAKARTDALVGGIRGAVRGVTRWVGENKPLVSTILAGVGVIGGLAAVTLAAGGAMTLLGTAAGMIAGAFSTALSPIALVGAALIGGAVYWTRYTESGQNAAENIAAAVAPLRKSVGSTVTGIVDALTAGDISLAAKIAGIGIKTSLMAGLAGIENIIGESLGENVRNLAADALTGNWSAVLTDLSTMWGNFTLGVVDRMAAAVKGVVALWQQAVSTIAFGLVKTAQQDGVAGGVARMIVGRDLRGKMAPMTEEQKAIQRRNLTAAIAGREQQMQGEIAAGNAEAAQVSAGAIAQFRQELEGVGTIVPDMLREANSSITQQTAEWRKQIEDAATDLQKGVAQKQAENNQEANRRRAEVGAGSFEAEFAKQQAELDRLTAEAKAKADAARAAAEVEVPDAGGKKGRDRLSSGGGATYSAVAAQFMAGASFQQRTATATEKMLKLMEWNRNEKRWVIEGPKPAFS